MSCTLENVSTSGSRADTGFCVGWSLLPVYSHAITSPMGFSGWRGSPLARRCAASCWYLRKRVDDCVALREHQVSHDSESGRAICLHEAVGHRPAVETDAEAVVRKYAVHLGKGGFQLFVVIVIGHDASVTGLVVRDVRRVRQDEVDAPVRKHRQGFEAVGVEDLVAEDGHGAVLSVMIDE